ncbi:hypothetical protein [Armatimonas sp.]|uniref:hypothetical protein n=1 Tax=Armatimonas sp. TaxID=1872638 RepID=UPI00374CF415
MLPTDLEAILHVLFSAGVRFVVVGEIAMRLHGCAHITDDVDISYARDRENLKALANALENHCARLRGIPEDIPFVLDEFTFRNVQNLTLQTNLGELDLLAVPDGADSFEGLWERSSEMSLGEFAVHVASIDDLITMKRAANRPKDQAHIYELLALKKLLSEG